MSYRSDYFSNFESDVKYQTEYELNLLSESEILSLFRNILNKGVHGLCFSLYEEGQKPGDIITVAQVKRRIEILKPHTKWVRTFSTTEGNELIPEIAKQHGMKTLVGAWLGKDKEKNAEELENLILLCQKGFVDIAAVGNEVLYRNDLSLEELLEQITYIKDRVPGIKVGYVDAYYEFSRHPELVDVSDVVLVNYYPFWEGTNFQNSLDHINNMHQQTKNVAKGKKIIITETGWPSQGENTKDAIPGRMNAIKYFINAQMWSKKEEVDMFYFSSFDESWKVGAEGEVGAYWGLWDKNEKLKFV
jgi:glucan 1,3-beta-glucosidase